MIDLTKLRALLAAADPLPPSWDVNALRILLRHGSSSVHGRRAYPNERLDRDAALISAVVNALPALLDELEALRASLADVHDLLTREEAKTGGYEARLTAWRTATGCDGPEQAAQLARDAVVVRDGHWDALLAEIAEWKVATGCDTPAEAATLRQQRDDAERNLTAPTRGHLAELDAELSRLRELEAAALDLDAVHAEPMHEGMDWQAMGERRRVARARMSAAIAACRSAREGT